MDPIHPTQPNLLHPTDREHLERDCVVEPVRAGGPGGQHRNKKYTGVRLTHLPTGLVVMATEERSAAQNRDAAFDRMARRLELAQRPVIPRKETGPSRAQRRRRREDKRQHAQKKASRRFTDD
ncbi:MAG: peptide chain release factor-like protein [Deltaproteobacteria bacterium]|nr:peptide chain release factor-like protein [Deltaproteobacteria bacterium]